jgi:AcrR family transcriptional regulator
MNGRVSQHKNMIEVGQIRKLKKAPAGRVSNRRDRRKLATRQALLDATLALLSSRSMDALTVDEIATRADVAKGTFYNYFPDKDALERELSWYVRARMETEISRTNEGVSDPAERIARAFCCVLHFCLGAPEQAAAMMRLFPHATDPAAPINSGVRGDVTEGLARGRIVASSEDVAVACIVGVFMAGVNRALDLSSGQVGTFAADLGAIMLHGLGLRRAQAERVLAQAVESVLL